MGGIFPRTPDSVMDSPAEPWYRDGLRFECTRCGACCTGAPGYVWVTPEGMNGLATFTMGALDLATGKMRAPQRTVVRKYKGEPKAENLVETQVTTTEDDEAALEAIRQGRTRPPARPRVTEPAPFNPGLFFVPRS